MYVDARDNYSETELKTERVFASSGSLTPREAAGRPGKAESDSRLLPRLRYEWLCIIFDINFENFAYPGCATKKKFS